MSKRGEKTQADILTILKQGDGSLAAYDILGKLARTYPKIAPTTVYRALAALIDQGLVHRIESLNAYMVCQHDEHKQSAILSICDDCGTVEESISADVLTELSGLIGKSGFAPQRHVIEIHGVCGSCGTGQASS